MSDVHTLPHRVLEIGSAAGDKIWLRETKGEPAAYACLSHTWGGFQPLKTTNETLEEHKRNIPWESIPKTFQDAVITTRRLNLQYIWIDSLCIIQDDENDWLIESALMADIYRNAVITLSAAASKGPSDGLFRETQPEHRGRELVHPLLKSDDHSPRFFTRRPIDHYRKDHPLLDRGWVLQERLLSPRVLHFGTYELIWECMQGKDCECGHMPKVQWLSEKPNFHPGVLSSLPFLHTANAWRKVVEDFCALALTFERDAFPALSGAAKIVKRSLESKGMQTRYVAGMWECWFIEDCLWDVAILGERGGVRPAVWRAPTWSWASVLRNGTTSVTYKGAYHLAMAQREGEEWLDDKALTLHARLESLHCELEGPDEMGPILSAHVVLTGPLLQAKLDGNDLDVPAKKYGSLSEFGRDYDFAEEGPGHIAQGSTLWCLMLVSLRSPLDKPLRECLWCLVLRQVGVEPDGQPVYERVGLLRYRWGADERWPVESWFKPELVLKDAVVKIV